MVTPRKLSIAAAADLQFALSEAATQFHQQHPQTEVAVSYGSSGNFYAQIRNGAEGILNGLQHARGEAVRRNMNIQFLLGNQSGWTITPASDATNIIASRVAEEGSNNAVVTVTPAGSDRITFNGMGWITNNGDSSPAITSLDITSATMAGNSEIRPLRVVIFTGGVPKMCDPSPALAAGDPRICP